MYHQFNLWQKNPLTEDLQSTLNGIRTETKTKEDKPVSMSIEKKLFEAPASYSPAPYSPLPYSPASHSSASSDASPLSHSSSDSSLLSRSSELKLEADIDMEKPIDPKYSQLRVFIPEDIEETADRFREPPLVYRFKDSAREPKHKRKKHHKNGRKDIKKYKQEYYFKRSEHPNWRQAKSKV